MEKVNDKWLRILLPAIPTLALLYGYLTSATPFSISKALSFLSAPAVCEVSRWVIHQGRRAPLLHYRKAKRVALVLLGGIVAAGLVLLSFSMLRHYISYGTLLPKSSGVISINGRLVHVSMIGFSFLQAFFFFPLIYACYQVLFHFTRLQFVERERSQLEKEKLQAELQQLKGIVNPHFLFNNLNSLSALIAENPAQAEAFLDELTRVFRYLLRTNSAELSTVAEELQFIHSYYHLLRTRYGQGIEMDVCVADDLTGHRLPPMTLQLLVENAVKHNRVQKDAPLRIAVFSQSGTLHVQNNRSRREQVVESTGIGLHSINARLQLLNQPAVRIVQNEQSFLVIVPLLEPVTSAPVVLAQPAGWLV